MSGNFKISPPICDAIPTDIHVYMCVRYAATQNKFICVQKPSHKVWIKFDNYSCNCVTHILVSSFLFILCLLLFLQWNKAVITWKMARLHVCWWHNFNDSFDNSRWLPMDYILPRHLCWIHFCLYLKNCMWQLNEILYVCTPWLCHHIQDKKYIGMMGSMVKNWLVKLHFLIFWQFLCNCLVLNHKNWWVIVSHNPWNIG